MQVACSAVVLFLAFASTAKVACSVCGDGDSEDACNEATSLLQLGARSDFNRQIQATATIDLPSAHVVYATTLQSTGPGDVGLLASMLSVARSLNRPTKLKEVVIHLIVPTVDLQDAKVLSQCFADQFDPGDFRPNVEVHAAKPIPFKPGKNTHKKGLTNNVMTFQRWLLPQYFPPNVNKVLYLDTDIIMQDDTSELFQPSEYREDGVAMFLKPFEWEPFVNDDRKTITTHYDIDAGWQEWKHLIPKDLLNETVLQAGVMLANLDMWRTLNITGRLGEMANSFLAANATLDDQLILTIVARQSKAVGLLPWRFNAEGPGWLEHCDNPMEAAIIHWAGERKPWAFFGMQPLGSCIPFDSYLPRRQCGHSGGGFIVEQSVSHLPIIASHQSAFINGSLWPLIADPANELGWNCPFVDSAKFDIEEPDALQRKLQHLKERISAQQVRAESLQDINGSLIRERLSIKSRLEAAEMDSLLFAKGSLRLWNPTLLPMPAGWKKHEKERWLASFRFFTMGKLWPSSSDAAYPANLTKPSWVSSHIVLAVLNDDMHAVRPLVVIGPEDISNNTFDCQIQGERHHHFGPEDARLVPSMNSSSDELSIIWSGRQQGSLSYCGSLGQQMFMGKIGSDLRLQSPAPIEVRESAISLQQVEKNWTPFAYKCPSTGQKSSLVQYSVLPHVVGNLSYSEGVHSIRHAWNTSSELVSAWAKNNRALSGAHGGVIPIRYTHNGQEVYVSLLHGIVPRNASHHKDDGAAWHKLHHVSSQRVPYESSDEPSNPENLEYKTALYTFEASPPFKIIGVSEKFLPLVSKRVRSGTRVAFPMQLLDQRSGAGNEFWVMYGQGDCQSQRLRLNATEFEYYLP